MQFHTLARVIACVAFLAFTPLAIAGEVLVSAAASLNNAFKEIARAYEAKHPGTKILLNFGASGALLQQMLQGAPIDVFASADQTTMDIAQKQGMVAAKTRQNFVSNSLVLITPLGSQQQIKQLADLAKPEILRIAISNPASVPAGRYSKQALDAAGLWTKLEKKIISTQNVRQSLDYVARGEVDAGFVYATDAALKANEVNMALKVPLETAIRYPIARTVRASNNAQATQFIAFVLSADGQAILTKYGFLKP